MFDQLAPIALRVLFSGAQSGAAALPAGLDVAVDWDWFNQSAIDWLKRWRLGELRGIHGYTADRAVKIIGDWVQSGDSMQVLESKLAPLLGKERAERIAITEVTRMYAEGNIMAWQSTGLVSGKRWQTAYDERVCPLCGPLHGKIVSLTGAWTMDETGAIVEGIGVTAPPMHPRCRCWLLPVVSTDDVRAARRKRLGLK